MPLGRHFHRKKALQAFYAYLLHTSASYHALYEPAKTPEVVESEANQHALHDARMALERASLSGLALPATVDHSAFHTEEYKSFYEKTLTKHQTRLLRDATHVRHLYERLVAAIAKDAETILWLYDELYVCSLERGGRLGQSPLFAQRAAMGGAANKAAAPPMETVIACDRWLKERDTPTDTPPSRIEDARHLVKLLRGKWTKEPLLQDYMEDMDPCWGEHKADLIPLLVRQIQEEAKYQAPILYEGLASCIFTPETASFGKGLLEQAIVQYPLWIEKIKPVVENWEYSRLQVIDRAILSLALSEHANPFSTPARVVLNEYIELAKTYSGPKGPAFINGVLDDLLAPLNEG